MAANLTQIVNFKANFHQEFELFSKIKFYANNHCNNGGHFKIVSIIVNIRPYIIRSYVIIIRLIISRNS